MGISAAIPKTEGDAQRDRHNDAQCDSRFHIT
jgi:hypothetical protein